MATILNPLPLDFYSVGKGVLHFFPKPAPGHVGPVLGYRLGDPQSFSINVEVTSEPIMSNEHDDRTSVGDLTTEKTVTITLSVRQTSDIVRAAAVMGTVGKYSQEEAMGLTVTFGEPGVYDLGDYGITINGVTIDGVDAIEGTPENGGDYLVDRRSGKVQTFTDGVMIDYDRPAITQDFATGIGSGAGLEGKVVMTGVNRQGKRSEVVIWDVSLKPSGAREFISDSEIQAIELTGTVRPVAGRKPGYEYGYEKDLPPLSAA